MLTSAYESNVKLNISKNREDLGSIKLHDCEDVDNYESRMDRNIKDYSLLSGPTVTSTTGTDAADTDMNAKTITNMSEQKHYFYLLRGIPMKSAQCNAVQMHHANPPDSLLDVIHAPKYFQMLPGDPRA